MGGLPGVGIFWQALGHELGNDLQDSIVPLVVPTHVECFRAVVEDMKQCLPLSTELTGTRKTFPPSPLALWGRVS